MYKIYKTLYLGSALSYENLKNKDKWFIIQATQEAYYNVMREIKYKNDTKSECSDWIELPNRMALNLEDSSNESHINTEAIEKCLRTIDLKLQKNQDVLVHCKFGMSRSASIVLLYLFKFTNFFQSKDFLEVEREFKEIYSPYRPTNGIRRFLITSLAKL